MSIRAILRGTLAGVAAGVVLAAVLALVVYHTSLSNDVVTAGLWGADGLVSLTAGFVAARLSPSGAALQGLLAALTLAVVGNLAAELSGMAPGPLWGQLGLAATLGMTGGLLSVLL